MTLRGARVLLAGACTDTGRRLCEAFLALGAHVVAADRLRTQLEELRAEMRQHERLWVAESDLSAASARVLFADVGRDEPIDAALLVLPAAQPADVWRGDPAAQHGAADALPRCFWFLRAALAHMDGAGRGRVLVVLEPGAGDLHESVAPALAALVQRCADAAGAAGSAPAVAGLLATEPLGAWLERTVALADPDRPAASGFLAR